MGHPRHENTHDLPLTNRIHLSGTDKNISPGLRLISLSEKVLLHLSRDGDCWYKFYREYNNLPCRDTVTPNGIPLYLPNVQYNTGKRYGSNLYR